MARLRIKEAVAQYNDTRPKGTRKMKLNDVAQFVYRNHDTAPLNKRIMFYGIVGNKRKWIKLEWLIDICSFTNVDMNFLIEK